MQYPARILCGTIAMFVAGTGAALAADAKKPRPHLVGNPFGPGTVYVVPAQPRDNRTPRQRCWDAEAARLRTPLTYLDRRTIDLKCSQR